MGVSMNGFYKSLLVVVFPTLVGCQQGRSKFQAFVWKQILSPALVFEGTNAKFSSLQGSEQLSLQQIRETFGVA